MFNTLWAIVLPGAVAPFTIFIFRVYIRTNIHQDLMDSVYVDGGSDLLVYTRIVLPLIKPMLATLGLFAAVGMWNSYVPALIYLNERSQYPLTLFLREMVVLGDFGGASRGRPQLPPMEMSILEREGLMDPDQGAYDLGYSKSVKMAFTMITVLPILFVYPFAQRYFVKGIMIGSLKG
jgi:putative aldouronate transport system permease protein